MALASPSPQVGLGGLPESVRPVALARERLLPVLPALSGLLPGGGLRRGSTVAVVPVGAGVGAGGVGAPGAGGTSLDLAGRSPGGLHRVSTVAGAGGTSLALAVLAGPSAAGSWAAVVGVPALGLVAAAEAGVAVDRLGLVPAPGPEWAAVVAALLDALDVVVVRPPARVRPADTRRLVARARERGAVLVPLGRWDGADVRLSVVRSSWSGLAAGAGHLRARLVDVVAEGRGASSRARRASLWLPAAGGGVAPAPADDLGAPAAGSWAAPA